MLKLMVVGGFAERTEAERRGGGATPQDQGAMTAFGRALATEIARQGHILVSGNRSDFDRVLAERSQMHAGQVIKVPTHVS